MLDSFLTTASDIKSSNRRNFFTTKRNKAPQHASLTDNAIVVGSGTDTIRSSGSTSFTIDMGNDTEEPVAQQQPARDGTFLGTVRRIRGFFAAPEAPVEEINMGNNVGDDDADEELAEPIAHQPQAHPAPTVHEGQQQQLPGPANAAGFFGTIRRIRGFFAVPREEETPAHVVAPVPVPPPAPAAAAAAPPRTKESRSKSMNTFGRVRNMFAAQGAGNIPSPSNPANPQRIIAKPAMKPASRAVNFSTATTVFTTPVTHHRENSIVTADQLEMSDI